MLSHMSVKDWPRYSKHVRILDGPPDEEEINKVIAEMESGGNELESIGFPPIKDGGSRRSVLVFRSPSMHQWE